MEKALRSTGDATLVVVALGAGDEVVGGMVGEWYPKSEVLLLAYLAVRPDIRGRGVGTLLLNHATEHWYAKRDPALSLAEVEHPGFHEVSGHGDPEARLRLYERVGALVLDMPYFQPQIRPGAGRVYDMMLIALGWRSSVYRTSADGDTIHGRVVRAFLDEYFEVCEGPGLLETDAEYGLLRSFTERPEGIRLLPLHRYRDVPVLDRAGLQPKAIRSTAS
jgi:GNAT superfamily N-acetyltransferase